MIEGFLNENSRIYHNFILTEVYLVNMVLKMSLLDEK